jgi:hypothetical protein
VRRGALFLLVLVLAGCGGDRTAANGCDAFGGGTTTRKSASSPSQTLLLTAVRTGSGACSDRVIFDFEDAKGAEPGYRVEYRPANEAQTEDASGNHIPIDGKAFGACTGPVKKTFKPGRHTFAVRAIDASGNVDATPAVVRWKFVPIG